MRPSSPPETTAKPWVAPVVVLVVLVGAAAITVVALFGVFLASGPWMF